MLTTLVVMESIMKDMQKIADDTLAAIAAMIAARNSCKHSWRQGVPDTLVVFEKKTFFFSNDVFYC